mgnify:CR=1 FL=1
MCCETCATACSPCNRFFSFERWNYQKRQRKTEEEENEKGKEERKAKENCIARQSFENDGEVPEFPGSENSRSAEWKERNRRRKRTAKGRKTPLPEASRRREGPRGGRKLIKSLWVTARQIRRELQDVRRQNIWYRLLGSRWNAGDDCAMLLSPGTKFCLEFVLI